MSESFELRHVAATTHGRYLLRPASGEGPAPLLVGFHGFGEAADASFKALWEIPGVHGWHLAAIEALHPFYTRSGRIVASWMTSQDRELAIADNIAYVKSAIAAIRDELQTAAPLVLAGFSQGTAMAYRAAAAAVEDCDGVLALCGDAPADLAEVDAAARPEGAAPSWRVLIGRGTTDPWYGAERMRDDEELLAGMGLAVETCVFAGGHEWHADFYRAAGRFLAALRDV